MTDVAVSGDSGKDKAPGTKWVGSSTLTDFTSAIALAVSVNNNAFATQTEVDTATINLKAKTETFTDAIKTATTDKTALNEAIAAANTAKTDVETSNDGKDLAHGTEWVSSMMMSTLDSAISTAQNTADKETANQNEVDLVKSSLDTMRSTFTNSRQTASTSKSSLESAISSAEFAAIGITVSATDPGTGNKWVLPADMATFTAAIAAANDVKNDTTASQNAVDAAKTTMEDATADFNRTVENVTHGTVPEDKLPITLWENGEIASVTLWENGSIASVTTPTTISGTSYFTAQVTYNYNDPYTDYQWYLNGVPIDGSTERSITIRAANYALGTYRLGVSAVKAGIPYTAEISFTVTN
jgi:hypothetical protein